MTQTKPPKSDAQREVVEPPTQFLYTLDQIAHLLNIRIEYLPKYVKFLEIGRRQTHKSEPPARRADKMRAVNILPSPLHEKPEWRVPLAEFRRFCKRHNIRIYERVLKVES